jgi:hypothetical protein
LLNRQAFFQTLSVLASVTDINVAHVLPWPAMVRWNTEEARNGHKMSLQATLVMDDEALNIT